MPADDAPPVTSPVTPSVETVAAAVAALATGNPRQAARALAAALGEQDWQAERSLRQVLTACGPAFVYDVLCETERVEAQGGLLRRDGVRRTRGGVFFQLVRKRVDGRTRWWLFYRWQPPAAPRTPPRP